jgi:hypothetical protein
VLPHEITHTIFATHFGCALPRWADAGGSTTVEHASERAKQQANLIRFLKGNKGIAFSTMFRMTDYPPEMLPLYAQGYSLTRFLIMHGGEQGKRKFVTFVGEGLRHRNWTKATSEHYGFKSLQELQDAWVEWVKKGSPEIETEPGRAIAPSPSPPGESSPGAGLTLNAPAPRDLESSSFPAQVVGGTRGVEDLSSAQGYQIPPRPSTFASAPQRKESLTAPEQNLARPTSTGWYARQKNRPQTERQSEKSVGLESSNEEYLQPVRAAAGSAGEPEGDPADTRPPLPGRKLMMEWSRQPRNVDEQGPTYAADERNSSLVASEMLAR